MPLTGSLDDATPALHDACRFDAIGRQAVGEAAVHGRHGETEGLAIGGQFEQGTQFGQAKVGSAHEVVGALADERVEVCLDRHEYAGRHVPLRPRTQNLNGSQMAPARGDIDRPLAARVLEHAPRTKPSEYFAHGCEEPPGRVVSTKLR